ncbi:mechanosensitive ion channel [Pseudoduganella ginsengisoli]|uniref:Mechanosensitive ion channel n=1 Tax=Pseudoduganella ginsengisoli TaxID=1462440 RepID=A0A6L6PT05_9BURK|nr:mechanosensitive ion channel domain-containing protein [Pseudoduganella ginsengisoli]MTW00595.1 mechanosensitive ion channel [Pseudoduganella ginsengisoli]
MKQEPLKNLISDLFNDMRDPGLLWQLAALVAAVLLGWLISSLLRARVTARVAEAAPESGIAHFGAESFSRVVGPLAVVAVLYGAQLMLGRWQKVHLLKVAVPIFLSLVLIRFAFVLLRRIFARQGQIGQTIRTFEKIFQLLVWAGMALYITGLWSELYLYLDQTLLPLGKHKVSIADVLGGAVSVALMLMLALWVGAVLEQRLMSVESMHLSMRVVLARFGRAILIVVAVLLSLSAVGIDLTVLSVFGGALGVGLGLGLQKIASNYVSGFIILLDRSLTIGDMITVDKYSGRVMQINTRYTVLQGLDGVESIVPNEMLVSGAVQNSTLSNKSVLLSAKVSVAYDTDLDLALRLLEQAALSVERVVKDKAPSANLVNFGADGLDLQVNWWIADPENGRGGVISDVNRAIWKLLQEHQISVPFPQREMRIIGPARLPEGS